MIQSTLRALGLCSLVLAAACTTPAATANGGDARAEAGEPSLSEATLAAAAAAAADGEVTVWMSPTCGCCGAWVDHMRDEGFTVHVHETHDVHTKKVQLGVAQDQSSCHTGLVDGYFVEGHVPASSVRKLLNERPNARGIAVPGMPIGSPGMEVGDRKDPYDVMLVDRQGRTSVYTSH
jgi:hypothetical protein